MFTPVRTVLATLAACLIFAGAAGAADTSSEAKPAEAPAAGAAASPGADDKAAKAAKGEAAAVAALKDFSKDAFVDAAYNNCATVENRSAKSCECERKLIGDRVNEDDQQMAYLYWTNKEAFVTRFQARREADPKWQAGFSDRFSNLQALIIAACGT